MESWEKVFSVTVPALKVSTILTLLSLRKALKTCFFQQVPGKGDLSPWFWVWLIFCICVVVSPTWVIKFVFYWYFSFLLYIPMCWVEFLLWWQWLINSYIKTSMDKLFFSMSNHLACLTSNIGSKYPFSRHFRLKKFTEIYSICITSNYVKSIFFLPALETYLTSW